MKGRLQKIEGVTPREKQGERVQKSVFECRITADECEHLIAALRREIGETAGNVRIYRLCESCWDASVGIGSVKQTLDSEPCVII
jgi:CRISPR-associated endonuclease Cas2